MSQFDLILLVILWILKLVYYVFVYIVVSCILLEFYMTDRE